MDIGTLYRRTVEGWTARVDAVRDDQWAATTPCADWDVRTLVNHVVGEDLWTEPLVHGQTIEEVGDRFEGDLLGDDARGTAVRAAGVASAAVADALPTGSPVHLSYGEEALEEYVAQLAADHLVHGWDLAAATGGDTALDGDLVDAVAAWFSEREEMYRQGGVIGPRVDHAPGDAQSQLLAHFGRDSRWAPPG
jgi:uncharacterized protein (TIGR03086 family)